MTGPAGQDGQNGVGIAQTTDNGDGTFTLLFTDGSSFTTSDLTGPAGQAGQNGATWLNGDNPPQDSTGQDGDFYLQSNGDFFQKQGGIWAQQGQLDVNPNDDIRFSDIANGEVTGTFDNLTVAKLLGRPIGGMPPAAGQAYFMFYNEDAGEWQAGSLSGDVEYVNDELQVSLLGRPIGGMPPAAGQAYSLVYDDASQEWIAASMQGEVGGNWNSLSIQIPLHKFAAINTSMIRMENDQGLALEGISGNNHGIKGTTSRANGLLDIADIGNQLNLDSLGIGVLGIGLPAGSGNDPIGVWGRAIVPGINNQMGLGYGGIFESTFVGVLGQVQGTPIDGVGVWGIARPGAFAGVRGTRNGASWAGWFDGNMRVTGQIFGFSMDINGSFSAGDKFFKIDHPLAPAEKYLYHSTVESPERKTMYDGIITTDSEGFATVQLPAYFEALNKDYRYQLTAVGTFAQAIVAEKINNNRFVIQTNQPHVEVCWQVAGVRNDAYAKANPVTVEAEKAAVDQGTYLHPEAFGQPAEKSESAREDKRAESANRNRTEK